MIIRYHFKCWKTHIKNWFYSCGHQIFLRVQCHAFLQLVISMFCKLFRINLHCIRYFEVKWCSAIGWDSTAIAGMSQHETKQVLKLHTSTFRRSEGAKQPIWFDEWQSGANNSWSSPASALWPLPPSATLQELKTRYQHEEQDSSGSTVGSCWDRPSALAGIDRKLQGELC
jgi:hypothetical protein